MNGIRTYLKKLRISKVIPFLAAIALVLAFFASTKASYADSEAPVTNTSVSYVYNSYSWQNIDLNIETANYIIENSAGQAWLNSEDRGYKDVEFSIKETFALNYYRTYNPNDLYMGYFNVTGDFTITATKNNSDTIIDNIIYLGAEHDFPYSFQNDSSLISTSTVGNMLNLNFTRRQGFNFYDLKFINTHYIENKSTYRFRVFYHSQNKTAAGVTISANLGTYPTGTGTVVYYRDPLYYDYNSNETLKSILSSLNSGTSDILDTLQNDSTGASATLATNTGLYDTAESQASSAMSGVLPNADTQLGAVTSYDYGSIYTDNVGAFSFWKSLGDFILSNSNLVGIGALLILCMFLGLVVYLLRL